MGHERLDLLMAKEIRYGSMTLRAEDTLRRQFVAIIRGTTKAGKANDRFQARGALGL
jgi:hypothetical protein